MFYRRKERVIMEQGKRTTTVDFFLRRAYNKGNPLVRGMEKRRRIMNIKLTENAKNELKNQNADNKHLRIFVQGVG